MAITKKHLKSKPVCKLRFRLSPEESGGAQSINVCGDFNDWDKEAHPMKQLKNGDFVLDVDVPAGSPMRFRYLADGATWLNDREADDYEFCSFAQAENSILKL